MNTLEEKINDGIKAAMFEKDELTKLALRSLKSAISLLKTDKTHTGDVTDEEILGIIQKQIKLRKESADIYKSQNREDLFTIEMKEVEALSKYLPTQLTAEDVLPIIKATVEIVGATSLRDMGKVMNHPDVLALSGKIEKKIISDLIKQQF